MFGLCMHWLKRLFRKKRPKRNCFFGQIYEAGRQVYVKFVLVGAFLVLFWWG